MQTLFLVYFDGAAVPAIVTEDASYRPARDSLAWEVRDTSGGLIACYTPTVPAYAARGRVIQFPQYPGARVGLRAA